MNIYEHLYKNVSTSPPARLTLDECTYVLERVFDRLSAISGSSFEQLFGESCRLGLPLLAKRLVAKDSEVSK